MEGDGRIDDRGDPVPARASGGRKKIIMRYSHSSAAMEEPHHTATLDFKKYVEEKTKGRVEEYGSAPPASSAARNAPFRMCSRASSR